MDRKWMYKTPRLDNEMSFVTNAKKFIAAAKKHRLSLGREETYCPCYKCENKYLLEDSDVLSHLIQYGFVKDYTVWTFHGEAHPIATDGASAIDDGGQPPSSSTAAPAGGDSANRDYININELLEDIAVGDDGGDEEPGDVLQPEDAELFENLANRQDDLLFGNPKWLENFKEMKKAAIDPLYKGCPKELTVLRFNLHMLMMKARHGWSDTSFNELLSYLADNFPEGNKVPPNTYRAKKMIRPVAMKVKKFHACPNHCILYRGEYETMKSCPRCGASRYKRNAGCRADVDDEGPSNRGKKQKTSTKKQNPAPEDEEEEGYMQRKIPALSVWYLPVIDRLRALFGNPEDAKLMSWHASPERTRDDGKLRHPSDGKQWKRFDTKFKQEFGDEPRNVRFSLSTDGMNPFGELSSSHSTWPVILTILNLPPHLCQKRRYLLLTMIISGPKQPGNDIDVFLEPLMEDMKELWEKGVNMLDASLKKEFTLKAIIYVTITDYPGLFSLSGQIKGKSGCAVCIDGTCYTYLSASKKLVYMRNRRFLNKNHRYRDPSMNMYFDNENEPQPDEPKKTSYGQKVFDMVQGINIEFGKKKKKAQDDGTKKKKKRKRDEMEEEQPPVAKVPFKKQSCFFKYLSYWKELDTPHAIDCMHLEKNVFESVIGVLLDMKNKTKDGLKSRQDLVNQNIRSEIHPRPAAQSGKVDLPGASYNLTTDEKRAVCQWLRTVKVPTGFSSNIKSLVSMKDLTLTSFNAHDCHVMLTVFLPIVIQAIGPEFVKMIITRLGYFFNFITQKVIDEAELPNLKQFIAETLCQFEMCFPPSFFDIMPHLMLHMVDQIQELGPVYLHQMWTYERFMSTLNRYVHNRAYPEGSMVEAYTTEESINCCIKYIRDVNAIGLPVHLHEGRTSGIGCTGRKVRTDVQEELLLEAHHNALNQLVIMDTWVEKHLEEIRRASNGRTEAWVQRQHKMNFTTWITKQGIPPYGESDESRLASGPSSQITSWEGYDINGYRFHTKEKDKKSAAQNSGVRYEGVDDATGKTMTYYGQIEEIWELDYGGDLQIPIFRCQWVKPKAVVVDDYGLTTVELQSVGFKDDQWVLANRAAQVAYYAKPKDSKRHVVVSGKQRIVGADGVQSPEDYNKYAELSLFTDHPRNIKKVENRFNKTKMMPWCRPDGQKKTVIGSLSAVK
jgi:hypothetical protein